MFGVEETVRLGAACYAPEVTRERLYLETMERVLGNADKTIVDKNAGQGVVPYLPLGDLAKTKGLPAPQPPSSSDDPAPVAGKTP